MRTPRLALSVAACAVAIPCIALAAAGCSRHDDAGAEARPEPVSLSRPSPARPGVEHGQDPRRAADRDALRAEPRAEDVEVTAPVEQGDEADRDRAQARKPAKRRRAGAVSREQEPAEASSLRAKRLVVAREVDEREPVGVARSFDAGRVTEVAAFVELINDAREPAQIAVRFEPPRGAPFEVPLEVGAAPRWRTWATTKRPLEAGTWGVRVVDEAGVTIARTTFEVVE